jgi:hypothetical protein
MSPTENVHDEIKFLLDQLRKKEIDLHKFMILLDMMYQDFLELNPEEHPYYEDRQRLKKSVQNFRERNWH